MSELSGYELSRKWFDFCFDNPEKVRPIHTAIYMFAIEHWNRLGQKPKFGFPSQMTMDAIGVKSYNTYIPAFKDIVEWGFFDLIEKSKNQYSSNIIALSKNNKATDKALDKAFMKHSTKQVQGTSQSKCSIDKQINKGTKEQENRGSLTTPEKIQSADTVQALSKIWFGVLRERNLHPGLSQQEMVQHQMSQWGVSKSKKIISEAVKHGWKNLKEEYLSEQQKQSGKRLPGMRTDAVMIDDNVPGEINGN